MSYYDKKDYSFIGFERSHKKEKKYNAVLRNIQTGRESRIPFGDSNMQQYKDTTGIGAFSQKDHKDDKRRESYRKRHSNFLRSGFWSAGYFSYNFLW